MRILIPGGSGQVGQILARHLVRSGHTVTVLSRSPNSVPGNTETRWQTLPWDGLTLGPWTAQLDRADAVIHLSGRTVNTRYTARHRREILDSRVLSTRLLGRAIAQSPTPPSVWMNAGTATIYRHALDRDQDELTGEQGGHESFVPKSWAFGVEVGRKWEQALFDAPSSGTRRIALRTSLVMSPDRGGVFEVLSNLVRRGLGGTQGNGTQFVSWMHDVDYARAVDLLLATPAISGSVNLTAPVPITNLAFMRDLRRAWGKRFGLPASRWMLELGALFLRTETELILKSRRVVPTILLDHGFTFQFPTWPEAADDLVRRYRLAQR